MTIQDEMKQFVSVYSSLCFRFGFYIDHKDGELVVSSDENYEKLQHTIKSLHSSADTQR